ncbi:SDR family NAD(P)-dependent oxidoreductase [Acuticoccus mangrovi]|uniref:SDR family oxidoreductase n=1 Tax=Acuticoccus mangrovi TaxID=2796142 RepID=A0A934MJ71_9HYPH|nr:SDR family NAD(P)-dependent oxidoreductase [Acuticoccus mangrovi]MBJ3777971.1 SDR family oxidoreductase [Acuticoccus mangrovi]
MTDGQEGAPVAVVTGGASGIGLGVAQHFASEGMRVVVWDWNDATLAEASAGAGFALTRQVDVTDEASVKAATDEVAERFGRIDILVNSAGIAGSQAPITDYALADWERCLSVNLTGTFLCCKHVVAVMERNDYGRIVNLSSMSGRQGTPRSPAYSAAKAGVIGLTNALGRELVQTNIRINCIAPSAIETEFMRSVPKARFDAAIALIPLGRLGRVEEVVAMIAFLASEGCSFTTGAVFDLSGGRAAI